MAKDYLARLPDTFRHSEALRLISERQLRKLITAGQITAMSRGVYRRADWLGDEDLAEIASKSPTATICLRSALARHDLIDDIPGEVDIAIPRGTWAPETTAPVRWRHFDPNTFDVGRDTIAVSGSRQIGIYNPERSIVDAFRLRHIDGSDMAYEALKRWIRQGGQPIELLQTAKSFPRAMGSLRHALEVLL